MSMAGVRTASYLSSSTRLMPSAENGDEADVSERNVLRLYGRT